MSNIIVTEDLVYVGMRVMRGRDWDVSYFDQDGHPGNAGTVISIRSDKWVKVKWDGIEKENNYRVGSGGKYDLYVYVPSLKLPNQKGVLLTPKNAYIGAIVKLRPEHEYRSFAAKIYNILKEGVEYRIQSIISRDLVALEGKGSYRFEMRNFYLVNPKGNMVGMVDMARKRLEELSKPMPEPEPIPYPYEYDLKHYDVEVTFKEKSKTNTNGTNTRDNPPRPIKVRRPISTIKGAKRRSFSPVTSRRS